ncbi:hypothetical protein AB0K51_24055 [Kitasatospora sp. NPDC049285]|uniref:hypothetical protein n=1 Tax=Kitasatospora sp. NPDC049285 TaxID=3157096 RepID=UPI0034448F8C
MDETYNDKLTELRALRPQVAKAQGAVETAEKTLAARKTAFEALVGQRAKLVVELAQLDDAQGKGETIAKAAGMKLGDVVRIAPALSPVQSTANGTGAVVSTAPSETAAVTEAAPAEAQPVPVVPEPPANSPDAQVPAPVSSPEARPVRILPSIPQGPAGERYLVPVPDLHKKRPVWEQRWYSTVWLDTRTGALAMEPPAANVVQVDLGARRPGDILDAVTSVVPGVRRIYITGGDPWHIEAERYSTLKDAVAAWLNAPSERWAESTGGGPNRDQLASHLVHPRNPVGRYIRAGAERNNPTIEIHSVGAWFQPDGADVAVVRHAFILMYEALKQQWDDVVMMAFPSAMGKDLWKRTIPTTGQWAGGFPVMSEELRGLLHATAGQGRTELIVPPRVPQQLPGLFEADRTFAYARHTHRSGVGTPRRVTGRAFEAMDAKQRRSALYDPSHWHIRATVPGGWEHVGVLPAPVPGERAWEYPATPGATFTTWAGGREVLLALENPQKLPWRIEVLDGLVWQEGDPLDEWSNKLKAAWSYLLGLSQMHGDERTRRAAYLASRGIRSIQLLGIGAFAQRPRVNHGSTPVDQTVPDGAMIIGQAEDRFLWERATPNSKDPWAHPEWSAGLWSDARAALLDMAVKDEANKKTIGRVGALHLPARSVVALRTDAIYTTEPIGHWPYFGRPGEYLLKGHLPGPVDAPVTEDGLLALRNQGRIHLAQSRQAAQHTDDQGGTR